MLYPALEDYALDIMIGKGPSAQSIRINLPRFTLVGATTRAGQITGPLRDRFGVLLKLELYSPDELSNIITVSYTHLDVYKRQSMPCSMTQRTASRNLSDHPTSNKKADDRLHKTWGRSFV